VHGEWFYLSWRAIAKVGEMVVGLDPGGHPPDCDCPECC